eukprot:CAMPEP_0114439414 /NCGR_PEP_ID=MMETSP0103-20121206/15183_1 /TAXON_ID=37642 ORGANISM="Paraphysomonas imperforata, Strain PA2" /NCGR_SAMPLE_ID=MMETSP0103 /ASSEMBLY_ACC=CAM_ASM_000201 /LENGTH=255 /DNA_ID=CAMNT_0001610169 /DNA_START=345 /DNA_END=1112 /DNA_ORIENTATION=-
MLAYTLFKATKDLASTKIFSKEFILLGFVFPLVLTMLPLTTDKFGNPGADRGWCFLDDRSDSPEWTRHMWIWLSFYFWIFSAMVISVIFLVVSFSILSANIVNVRGTLGSNNRLTTFLGDEFAVRMIKSINKIVGYPIIILICWGPSLIYDLIESSSTSKDRIVEIGNFFFPGLQGLFVAIVFLVTNREAKSYVSDLSEQVRSISTNTATEDLKFGEDCYDVNEPDFIVNPSEIRMTNIDTLRNSHGTTVNPMTQ